MLFILLISFSCSPPGKDLYEFDPDLINGNNPALTRIADNIIYIPLDNRVKIRLINDVIMTQHSIFLSSDEGILKFNREGKIVRRIGNKGRGPGEYTYCANFTVDKLSETVYVKDRDNLIKVYSKDGTFMRDINLQNTGSGIDLIEFYDSRLFVSYFLQFGESEYNWIITDTLGKIIRKQYRSIPYFTSNWLECSRTYNYQGKLFYWNPYNDTVFSISNDCSYKPSFLIGEGKFRLPASDFDPAEEITHFMLIKSMFETRRFLVLKYSYNRKGNITLVDKKNRNSFLTFVESFEDGGITNDIDGGVDFQPVSYYAENEQEYMIGFFNPYKLKNHVYSDDFKNIMPKYPEKKKQLEGLAGSLSEYDNPVLMFVTFK